MMYLEMKQIIFILQCLCTFWLNSDNYSDTSGSLWQFRRDEVPHNNAKLNANNSQSFKYKAALLGKTTNAAGGNIFVKDIKIVVPLKYLSNFWRSL